MNQCLLCRFFSELEILSCASMNKLLIPIFCFALLGSISGNAQTLKEQGCGTITTQEELAKLQDFVEHNPAAYAKPGGGSVDTIPLTIQIVGKDNGTGYYSLDHLFQVICQLNERYTPVNLYFAIKFPIKYINKDIYYDHTFTSGSAMMQLYNVANTANIYFCE